MSDIIFGTGVPKLSLGQNLYIPLPQQRLVVVAQIDELTDIYQTNDVNAKTVWHIYDSTGKSRASTSTDEVDDLGWHLSKDVDLKELSRMTLCNQFPWTNFPTWGHATYIGEDAFTSLQEARKCIAPSNKKHLHRRLKAALASRSFYYNGNKWDKIYSDFYKNALNLKVYVRS